MASFLISLAVLLWPPIVVFYLVPAVTRFLGDMVGVGVIAGTFLAVFTFVVCVLVVIGNYAWFRWW